METIRDYLTYFIEMELDREPGQTVFKTIEEEVDYILKLIGSRDHKPIEKITVKQLFFIQTHLNLYVGEFAEFLQIYLKGSNDLITAYNDQFQKLIRKKKEL
jgi:hypothetical protein